jgi:hypothetical protein
MSRVLFVPSSASTMSASNSLGLELEVEKLSVNDPTPAAPGDWGKADASTDWSAPTEGAEPADGPAAASTPVGDDSEKKPKTEPYINPDRVWQTGGQKRVRAHTVVPHELHSSDLGQAHRRRPR